MDNPTETKNKLIAKCACIRVLYRLELVEIGTEITAQQVNWLRTPQMCTWSFVVHAYPTGNHASAETNQEVCGP